MKADSTQNSFSKDWFSVQKEYWNPGTKPLFGDDRVGIIRNLLGLSILCVLFRTLLLVNTYLFGTDAEVYLKQVRKFKQDGFFAQLPSTPDPVYPSLIYWMDFLIGNEVYAGYVVSLIFSVVGLIFLFVLSRLLFNEFIANITSLVYLFHPSLVDVQADIMQESTFFGIFLGSTYFFFRFLHDKTYRWLVLSGVLAGLACLTRSEGIFLLLFPPCFLPFYLEGSSVPRKIFELTKNVFWFYSIPLLGVLLLVLFSGHQPSDLFTPGKIENLTGFFDEGIYLTGPGILSSYGLALDEFIGLNRIYLLFPLAIGLYELLRKRNKIHLIFLSFPVLYIGCQLIGYLFLPPHYPSKRYLLLPFILLFPILSNGVITGVQWMSGLNWIESKKAVLTMLFFLVVPLIIISYESDRRLEQLGIKEAGTWLNKNASSKQAIVTSAYRKIGYFSGIEFKPPSRVLESKILSNPDSTTVIYLVCTKEKLNTKDPIRKLTSSYQFRQLEVFPRKKSLRRNPTYLYKLVRRTSAQKSMNAQEHGE